MVRHTRASNGQLGPNEADTVRTRAVKSRRSHRKSRNGCTECKNRHIRCDERQPLCANCEIAERTCTYPTSGAAKLKRKQNQQNHASQQHQPEASAVTSSTYQLDLHSNASIIDNANPSSDAGSAQMSFHPHNHPSALSQVAEQFSDRSLPAPRGSTFLDRPEFNPQRIPSPASTVQLADMQVPPTDCLPGLWTISDDISTPVFTPQHVILLRHADEVPNFTAPKRSIVDVAINRAIDAPYLIDEVLALTAFHMAHVYPGSAAYLQRLATELQTRALASFTRLTKDVPNDDKATAVPRFLFPAVLGRHVLADTLVHCRSDFHLFIDRFVECFQLNRGIRAVTPPARDYLYNSEIQPFLRVILDAQAKLTSVGHECDPLNRLMDDSDLSESGSKACRQAISSLQRSFDLCYFLDVDNYPQSVSTFAVGIEVDFVNMLRKHRPEALVILAYFGVLLHRCRSFWAFCDAGAFVIRSIARHVGSYWQESLAWPLHVLQTEPVSEPLSPERPEGPPMSSRTPT